MTTTGTRTHLPEGWEAGREWAYAKPADDGADALARAARLLNGKDPWETVQIRKADLRALLDMAKPTGTHWADPPDLSARARATIDKALNPIGGER